MCCRQTACSLSVTRGEIPERLSEGAALAIGVTAGEPPYGDAHGDRAAEDRQITDVPPVSAMDGGALIFTIRAAGTRAAADQISDEPVGTVLRPSLDAKAREVSRGNHRAETRGAPYPARGEASHLHETRRRATSKGKHHHWVMERSLRALTQCGGLLRDQAGRSMYRQHASPVSPSWPSPILYRPKH